jgi:putative transposase
MTRKLRLDSPFGRHHVFNRVARRDFFLEPVDAKHVFLDVLASLPERHGVRIHGYALMSNHFHLMLETPRANLSRTMQDALSRFTKQTNRMRGWDGPIFRGRFGSQAVYSEEQWRYLLAYLHLNPVHAGIVADPEAWGWSSSNAYTNRATPPRWLTTSDLIASHGSIAAMLEYQAAVHAGFNSQEVELILDCLKDRESELETQTVSPTSHQSKHRQPAQVVIMLVAAAMGVSMASIQQSQFGSKPNVPRWVTAHFLTRNGGMSHREAGEALGCTANAVAKMLKQLRTKTANQPNLGLTIDGIAA